MTGEQHIDDGQSPIRRSEANLQFLDGVLWEADPVTLQATQVMGQTERLLGYSSDEWLAAPDFWSRHVHPDDRDRVIGLWSETIRQGKVASCEYRMIAADGRVIWVKDSFGMVSRPDGARIVQGIMVDVTPRKEAEEKSRELEERYRQLFEQASEIIYGVDRDLRFTFINPAGLRFLRRPGQEMLGRWFLDLVRPDMRARFEAFYRKQFEELSPATYCELPVVAGDGGELWIGQNVRLVMREGKPVGADVIARDITKRKAVETVLRENEDRYRKLAENSPMGIWQVDPEGLTVYANPAMCRMLEVDQMAEVVGVPYTAFFPPESLGRIEVEDAKRRQGIVTHYEAEVVGRRGGRSQVLIFGSPLFGSQGEYVGSIGTFEDISERKRAEEALRKSEERFRSLFEEAPLAYHEVDRDGIIQRVNRTECRLLGYTREEMIGKSIFQFIAPEKRSVAIEEYRQMIAGIDPTRSLERDYICKDGSQVPVSVHPNPIRDEQGRIHGFRSALVDVTERRIAEMAARKVRAYAQELRRKNDQLMQALVVAREATATKTRFLTSMSHELRTPLNAIIGFSELMLDGQTGQMTEEQREYLGDILTSARHLLQLINDVLDLAKVESGKMEFRPERTDLVRLVREVCDVVRPLAVKKEIYVSVSASDGLDDVELDPGKFKQVLYNYISNAIKFTPAGGRVDVEVRAENSSEFRLEVRDTGIGIRPEDMDRLFMEFQQLGPTRGQEVGTGLGLALTKHVIEAQGGRVGAESRFGVGSKFYAVLPRSPKPVAAGPMLDDSAAMAESKLLVVEDNVAASEWLAGALRDSGHHVKIAVTGADAITLCRAHMFDCILLDPLLPDTSGWEVLHALRARTLNRGTPALVVSLNPASEAAGGFAVLDFLMKPLNPGDLLASLERGGVPPDGRKTVLVVDQDVKALRMMQASLTSLGYRVSCHSDAEAGLASALRNTPAAVVLDLTMPGTSGFEFLDRLRADVRGYQIPVLVWANKDLDEEDYAVLKSNLARVFLCEKSTLQAFTGDLRELLKGRM